MAEELGHGDLVWIWGAETGATGDGLLKGGADGGVIMAMDCWAPGANEVYKLDAIGGVEERAIGTGGKEGGAADATEGADGGIYAARDALEGAVEKLLGCLRVLHGEYGNRRRQLRNAIVAERQESGGQLTNG